MMLILTFRYAIYIMQSQTAQMDVLNEIVVRKDAMLNNDEAVIEGLKRQVAEEQKKRKKYALMGVGVGAVVMGVVLVVAK